MTIGNNLRKVDSISNGAGRQDVNNPQCDSRCASIGIALKRAVDTGLHASYRWIREMFCLLEKIKSAHAPPCPTALQCYFYVIRLFAEGAHTGHTRFGNMENRLRVAYTKGREQ